MNSKDIMDRQNDSSGFYDESTTNHQYGNNDRELYRLRQAEAKFKSFQNKINSLLYEFNSNQGQYVHPIQKDLENRVNQAVKERESIIKREYNSSIELVEEMAKKMIHTIEEWLHESKKAIEERRSSCMLQITLYKDNIDRSIDELNNLKIKMADLVSSCVDEDPTYIRQIDSKFEDFKMEIKTHRKKVEKMIEQERGLRVDVKYNYNLLNMLKRHDTIGLLSNSTHKDTMKENDTDNIVDDSGITEKRRNTQSKHPNDRLNQRNNSQPIRKRTHNDNRFIQIDNFDDELSS